MNYWGFKQEDNLDNYAVAGGQSDSSQILEEKSSSKTSLATRTSALHTISGVKLMNWKDKSQLSKSFDRRQDLANSLAI
jgi:hypothetical protein